MTIRVYWRDADCLEGMDFVRCDEFSLSDVLNLLELTKKVDYVREVADELGEPYVYGYSELVLGSPETKEVDRVDIYLDKSKF